MRYLIPVFIILSLIILGGCQSGSDDSSTDPNNMEEADLPDEKAFEDDFTRSFLQSVKETESGYYPFLSAIDTYQMDFPAGGVIDEASYTSEENNLEHFFIHVTQHNRESVIDFTYDVKHSVGDEQSALDSIGEGLSSGSRFEEILLDDRKLYVTNFPSKEFGHGYLGYMQNELSDGGIEIIYETDCDTSSGKCINEDKVKHEIISWMRSINFVVE